MVSRLSIKIIDGHKSHHSILIHFSFKGNKTRPTSCVCLQLQLPVVVVSEGWVTNQTHNRPLPVHFTHATYLSCQCKDGAKYILAIPGIVSILQKNSSHFCPAKSYYVSTKMTRYGETEITCEILNNLRYAGITRLATLLEALFWAANLSAVNDIITYFNRVVCKRLKQRNFSRIKCLRVWCM